MFGIGTPELIALAVLALIIFGPQRLPEIAGQIGKAIRDFRQMSADVTGEFNRAVSLEEPSPAAQAIDAQPVTAPVADAALAGHGNGADDGQASATADLTPQTATSGADTGEVLVATKADPRAAASLLDEDGTVRTVAPRGQAETVVYRPADDDVVDVSREVVPTSEADAVLPVTAAATAVGGATGEPGDPIAGAWDAVITTDLTGPAVATATLDEPDGAQAAQAETDARPPYASTPEPIKVDPTEEPTIREVIEAQIAAEAFRERRRLATYNRARKRN